MAFLVLVWPFPVVFEKMGPVALYRFLFLGWGGGILCVAVWAYSYSCFSARRARSLQEVLEKEDTNKHGDRR